MTGFAEMESYILDFPEMWDRMWKSSRDFQPELATDIDATLLCGMGGSSIGGALLKSLLGDSSSTPIVLNRDYTVPRWAGPSTLAVFTSYSGNTEETLGAYSSADAGGAHRIAVTSGGKMKARCERDAVPFLEIPGGLPPRAALPYTLVPQLHIFRHAGLLDLHDDDIAETGNVLRQITAAESGGAGRAAEIAESLHDRIPVVYSGPGLLSAANVRWRGQLQENAKSLAFGNLYPELNHNEIVGWQDSDDVAAKIVVIELVDSDDAPPIRKRMELTRELLEPKAADWIEVQSVGRSRLARMMSTVLLGDWVSLRLAGLKGVDPMPVELIDALKSGLEAAAAG